MSIARNSVVCILSAFFIAGAASHSVRAADVGTDTGPTVRFLLESQSGYSFLDGGAVDPEEDDAFGTTGAVGRINIEASPGWNIQGDIFGDYAWLSHNADDSYKSQIGGGLHLYSRNERGAVGLFGALGELGIANDSGGNDGGTSYLLGAEAQLYQDDWTFYLQAGWLDSNRSDDVDMFRDTLFVRGVARHYFAADTLLQAEASYVAGEMDDDNEDMDILSVGARLQHRFDFWPGAFYVGYRGDFATQDDTAGPVHSHTALFGATYTFGSNSLMDNERNGVAMDLPAFLRWQGIAAGPLE